MFRSQPCSGLLTWRSYFSGSILGAPDHAYVVGGEGPLKGRVQCIGGVCFGAFPILLAV